MKPKILLCFLCTLLAFPVRLVGQDPEVVRITTNLVQVDLVVTKDGKQITNLKPEDFEILEDGRLQKITSFTYVSTSPSATISAPSSASNTETAPPSIPKPPLPSQVKRTIAIVVDDLGLSFESMANLRTYLGKFISENVQSNDLIAIIRTGGEVGALQQFTSDPRALSSAISDLKWNPCSRVGAGVIAPERSLVLFYPPERQLLGRIPPDKAPSSGQVDRPTLGKESNWCSRGSSVSYSISALRFILKGMSELPGRKSMMVISDSLPLHEQEMAPSDFGFKRPIREDFENLIDVWTQSTNHTEKMYSLGEMAIRASVVIYGVSSQRLQTTGIQPADEISFPPPDARAVGPKSDNQDVQMKLLRARSLELSRSQDAIEVLAKETGGFVVRNKNEFGLDKIFEDQSGYYLIGYRPESTTFDRRFHTIKARVKRDGLTVRTRTGFYGVEETKGPSDRDSLNSALVSPFSKNDIAVRLATLFANDPKRGSLLRVFLTVNAKDLSFTLEPDGTHVAKLDFSTALFGQNGAIANRQNQSATLRLRGKPYERAMREGVFYGFDLPIKQAGAFQLRLALRDAASQRIGASGQFIQVPNLSNGGLALSGILLQADVAEDQQSNLVMKRFHQGTALAFGYSIYNAALDKTTRLPKLKTTTLVFRDGVKIYSSEPAVVAATGQADLQRIFTGARLQLGAALTPGEYALQIVVEDQITKSSTTQWTQFEVIR